MNNKWQRVETIFHHALELPLAERVNFLQRECGGDDELRVEVETLLTSLENDADFLNEPVFELGLGAISQKPAKDLTGLTIGNYQIEEKIGSGGMGEVYKAIDTSLDRPVALKFLSETLENNNSARRQLVKEARASAALDHPNICAVHGIEQTDEHHFIVMQYVEGITLAEKIEGENIGVEVFKQLTQQILSAVAFAHSHGIIHRDLKPGNIMLTREGQIKVLDFGLAKVISPKPFVNDKSNNNTSLFSTKGLIIGTVSYMSPEQLRGEKLDFRSDIFSVGIILYELLARQNPFQRQSQAETIAAILNEQQPPLKDVAADLPENLRGLVNKCLYKDKDERFQSAAEVLVELDTTESRIPVKAFFRHQSFWLKTLLATIVLLAVLGIMSFYNAQNPQISLAILPISIESTASDKEYLADGLAQSITDKLSNLSDLKVKSQTSVARYKGNTVDLQTIGKELGVDAILIGLIKNRVDGLVFEVKLFRASDGVLIGREEFKTNESKMIKLQEEFSQWVISKIHLKLSAEDKTKLAKKDTESETAKDLYMQGRFYLKRRKDSDDVDKAIKCFFDAKEIDQNYAKAWAGLSDAYLAKIAPGVKNAISPGEAVESARKAAEKALELDNTLAESYYSLGLIEQRYEWNWSNAENYFRIATSRDPEFLSARFGLIYILKLQQRFDEALEEIQNIKQYDPLAVNSDIQIALIYYQKRDYYQTDKILSDLIKRFPDDMRIKYVRVYQLLKTNRVKEAIEILEPIYKSNKEEDKVLAAAPLGFAYAKMGRRNEAVKIIKDLSNFRKNIYVPAQEEALIYVGLGNFDKVFEFLERSCLERYAALPGWITDPIVDDVKSDVRFEKIKECVNL